MVKRAVPSPLYKDKSTNIFIKISKKPSLLVIMVVDGSISLITKAAIKSSN